MSDVSVGMRLKSTICESEPVVTVTEVTGRGFHYEHDVSLVILGNSNGVPEFGTCRGGECFDPAFYEPA